MTEADNLNQLIARCFDAISEVVVGQRASVELLLVAVLCDGHVLIEDVPGTGKTSLAKALAGALGLGQPAAHSCRAELSARYLPRVAGLGCAARTCARAQHDPE